MFQTSYEQGLLWLYSPMTDETNPELLENTRVMFANLLRKFLEVESEIHGGPDNSSDVEGAESEANE